MKTTPTREQVLNLVREERARQVRLYGTNDDLLLGFGGTMPGHPWLTPFSEMDPIMVESAFRSDYERYEEAYGKPTWMHLIREEVAELFATRNRFCAMEEAVQVAALCTSLVEHLRRDA